MLGLPSTTEVGRRLPKEAFYRNLKLDARTRDEFVHLIESITIANSIKPSTANIEDGEIVHEIMVLEVLLKGNTEPTKAIGEIARANPHRLVFRTEPTGLTYVLRKRLYEIKNLKELVLVGKTLDTAWDSICSQVIFGDVNSANVDARIERARHIAELEADIVKLDNACRKARQISRKNKLYDVLRKKKSELARLRTLDIGP